MLALMVIGTKAQNIQNGSEPDGTSGILRVNQDGQPVLPGILGNKYPFKPLLFVRNVE